MSLKIGLILSVISLAIFVSASLDIVVNDGSGTVLMVDGIPYYIPSAPRLRHVQSPSTSTGFTLITSIRSSYSPITKAFLESQLNFYVRADDVWNNRFLGSLIVSYDGPATGFFDDQAKIWLESSGISHLYVSNTTRPPVLQQLQVTQITTGPPPGPYVISPSSTAPSALDMYDVYRLYKDEYESFLFGAIPEPAGDGWIQTNITSATGSGPQFIPVSSRLSILYGHRPLSGTRFALKDIFNARGLPTGAGSLAYARVHPVPNVTAPSIQKLISLGATMVGKTRTSQFAQAANPWDFIDIPYPWNPRADGYLTASGSSTGSACAIAGYDWIDFAVGSDTRGSVRKPAALVGAYGIRPTLGSIDLDGVVPLSEYMDTAGFFARDPRLFHEISRLWYSDSPVKIKRLSLHYPKKLLYPTDHFPVNNPTAQVLYDSFVSSLTQHFNISKEPLNFTHALLPHLPNGNFSEFQLASNTLAEYRSWTSVGKPLIEIYEQTMGRKPDLDPNPRKTFSRGMMLTEEDFAHAAALQRQFSKSIASNLLKADRKSCSESIFMYDAGTGGHPSYRVEDFNALSGATRFLLSTETSKPSDFFNFVATMAGLPEITLPIGQVPYYSQISRNWEMLPVAVQLVAHPGCDDMLTELVKKLAETGVISSTMTGGTAF